MYEVNNFQDFMYSTFFFDLTYYVLALAMSAILVATTLVGLRVRSKFSDSHDRGKALGISLAPLAALITLVGSVVFLTQYRSGAIDGFLDLQAQFSAAYLGFVLLLYGIDRSLVSNLQLGKNRKHFRILMWCAFILTVAVSSVFLFNPTTYTVTHVGSQEYVAQQVVFWFPLFLTLLIGALTSFQISLNSSEKLSSRYSFWFGLFSVFVFFGTLKESNVIPSSGDNLTDLLLAFVPFIVGSFCILMSALSLYFLRTKSFHALKTVETNESAFGTRIELVGTDFRPILR
ncbi:MAG: hypothetical protein OK457_08685 [Thaumarchaeota archaeon]|nr:hypothetical protein [Nitrososphaerota archaeon]